MKKELSKEELKTILDINDIEMDELMIVNRYDKWLVGNEYDIFNSMIESDFTNVKTKSFEFYYVRGTRVSKDYYLEFVDEYDKFIKERSLMISRLNEMKDLAFVKIDIQDCVYTYICNQLKKEESKRAERFHFLTKFGCKNKEEEKELKELYDWYYEENLEIIMQYSLNECEIEASKFSEYNSIEKYKNEFKLFNEELNDFISFLNDPDKKMYFPISRAIVKCEDGRLCLHKGRYSTQMPEEK